MEAKNYYATAQYYTDQRTNSSTLPAFHRYFVFVGFDTQTAKLVNEKTLTGEWSLMCGKREQIDFNKETITTGRELSELSEFTGQVYKRTPQKKTFLITRDEFRASLNLPSIVDKPDENVIIFEPLEELVLEAV